ncbi:MAG TPA: RNA 3'-terminal phosphate cyclase [Chthonomonadaceae bacterium]|nr:RNA 3'-terminal phosphate cyclase [Chthonomonadaceae bacterium]
MNEKEALEIDGAYGEGGGQIIRTSMSLAAITGRAIELKHIRARRSRPGLQAQHLTAVRAMAAFCHGILQGDTLDSQQLRFDPGTVEYGPASDFTFDVAEARGGASAGATGLVAQTLFVPMFLLEYVTPRVTILGGTHVPMSPTADYLQHVYVPALCKMGLLGSFNSDRAGFFPRGGGAIRIIADSGVPTTPIDWTERGRMQSLRVTIVTSQLPEHVAARGEETVLKELKGYGVPVTVEKRDLPSHGAGAAVVITAACERGMSGFTSLGERGKPMERVALEAVRDFKKWFASGAPVDEHLADQLVLPCALMPYESRWTTPVITDHLRTVLWTAQQFLPIEYTLEERGDGSGLVTLRGVEGTTLHKSA